MKTVDHGRYVVESDGTTVWVNGDQLCLGRFGRQGIDIHRADALDQDRLGPCLMCTHGPVTLDHWGQFMRGMEHFHGVEPQHLAPYQPKGLS